MHHCDPSTPWKRFRHPTAGMAWLLLMMLCVLLLVQGSLTSVTAQEPAGTPSRNNLHQAVAALLAGWRQQAEIIDLSDYKLTVDELRLCFRRAYLSAPDVFYVDQRLSYDTHPLAKVGDGHSSVLVGRVYPYYTLTGDRLTLAMEDYRARLDQWAEGAPPSASEVEKVLYLHDFLCATFDYDVLEIRRDAYALFRDGVGVCQAYALAFLALAQTVGLEAQVVYNEEMNHAWNIVCVEGSWYHVDVTRDDPIRPDASLDDPKTSFSHQRFLRSDQAMAALGYGPAVSVSGALVACTDRRFETAEGAGCFEAVANPLCLVPVGVGGRAHLWYAPPAVDQDMTITALWFYLADCHGQEPPLQAFTGVWYRGDVNGDGCCSIADLILLSGYVNTHEGGPDCAPSLTFDLTQDGLCTSEDVDQLRLKLVRDALEAPS